MTKCSFCGINVIPGTGKSYIQKEGKILFFCSRKCEVNMLKLKRLPRDFKWTKFYEKGTVSKEENKVAK